MDEAHNLLSKDRRNHLLASVITILNHRNSSLAVKYLTPFINDIKNIGLKFNPSPDLSFFIDEYVKTEFFYLADFRSGNVESYLYDQFTNCFIERKASANNHLDYVFENSVSKNIIYFNKPTDIELFIKEIIPSLPEIQSDELKLAVDELSELFDPDYLLINSLKRGLAYHHGSMTESVRNYVEYLFRECTDLKFLVSSSTLLEGINMPIERLFLLCTKKGIGNLSASHFKNLVGRVNRFSEIFNEPNSKSVTKLKPEVHIVGTDKYSPSNANYQAFLENRVNVSKESKDDPKNVLLDVVEIDEGNQEEYTDAVTRLENLENGIVDDYKSRYVSTLIGKLLIANSVTEINIFDNEGEISEFIDNIAENSISSSNQLIGIIYDAFISYIDDSLVESPLIRLRNKEAQMFYSMLLDWKIENKPFKLMIRLFINYWDDLFKRMPDFQIYVGKWGDETKHSGGHRAHYTRVGNKTRAEKVNLAIVRIKEEEDFLEHELLRFIEILNDLNKLDVEFYKMVKYGSTNEQIIKLIKIGFSKSVAELILAKYSQFISNVPNSHSVKINNLILDEMMQRGESLLQQLEVRMNVSGG
ncbi:MAG: hypothetical protein ABJV04_02875 [Aliiglaciecola sp.]|uniref:hypothetical protein n=1 Tax=Aliiglaciecola sp. TaxID=1872441 RepID=UPI0032967E6B